MDAELVVALETARAWLARSQRVAVLTGAGISTDSGIPDFRGPEGVWTKDPEAEKTATLSHYLADAQVRRRAWRGRLRSPVWTARPNAGHLALIDLERSGRLIALITQNVDGLHHAAGSDPALIVEAHGAIRETECLACHERGPMERTLARVAAGEEDPPCRACGGILKAATVSFGQSLDPQEVLRAERAARSCDLLLAVGSTLSVYPIADVVPLAKAHGALVVILNGGPTAMDHLADAVLTGSISEMLPALVAGLERI